jgi:putative FmdB family regulatory protein
VVVDARLPHVERLTVRAPAARLCDHAPAVPTYDYLCRSCGHTTEVIHSMMEEGPSTCDRCGGQLRRVLFPAGIIFKGSGFYKTDSRSSSAESAAGTSSTAKPDASGDGKAPAGAGTESSRGAESSGGAPASGGAEPSGGTSGGTGPPATSGSDSAKKD